MRLGVQDLGDDDLAPDPRGRHAHALEDIRPKRDRWRGQHGDTEAAEPTASKIAFMIAEVILAWFKTMSHKNRKTTPRYPK